MINKINVSWLAGFIMCLSAGLAAADPRYQYTFVYNSENSRTDTLVRYTDAQNPCWVYLYWVYGRQTTSPDPVEMQPLPGQDFRTQFVPNEAIRRLDQRSLLLNATRAFDSLLMTAAYAHSRDPDLASLSTLHRQGSSLSFQQVLLYQDPVLRVSLDDLKLVNLGLSDEDLLKLSRLRSIENTPHLREATLGSLLRATSRKTDLTDIENAGLSTSILNILAQGQHLLLASSQRMQQSWTIQRAALSENR